LKKLNFLAAGLVLAPGHCATLAGGRVASEGRLVTIVAPKFAEPVLAAMRAHPLGCEATIIGEVVSDDHRFVETITGFGGGRIVDWLSGEQLPRIC
jgi:hydrogenase expression/formation protein HypE